MIKRMIVMLVAAGIVFGGIFGYKAFRKRMTEKYMAANRSPAVTVSTIKASFQSWQPQTRAVGTLRAVRGVDVTTEVPGLVRGVNFQSGDEVKEGQVLVQLNADQETAQLDNLKAAANLARIIYERDKKQLEINAVSQATVDTDVNNLKGKQAEVAAQAALIAKKAIKAPFSGQAGITTVNPGQYLNPGDKVVTLQNLDSLYVDFSLPQQEYPHVAIGQSVDVTLDAYPGKTFSGTIRSVSPLVDRQTRNFAVEAEIENPKHQLLPGMFAAIEVRLGKEQKYLTLPQTAVSYNPYGDTVYVVKQGAKSPQGKPVLTVEQTFVTLGPMRGDQVAVLEGVSEGDTVVTSGQLKLKNGSVIEVNNGIQPENNPDPQPVDR